MASNPDFIAFVTDQLQRLPEIATRMMMGDYCLYYKGKVVALLCDNKFYLKPTPAGLAILGEPLLQSPYPGAKEHYYIDDIDNQELLCHLVEVTYEALPEPKPRKKK